VEIIINIRKLLKMPDLISNLSKVSENDQSEIGDLCHSLISNIFVLINQSGVKPNAENPEEAAVPFDSVQMAEFIDFLERSLDKFQDL